MMTHQPRTSRGIGRTVLRRASIAAVTAGAVVATTLGLDLWEGPDAARSPEPVAVGTPVQTEAEARTVARKSGKQVEVLGLRTERREIFAAPDGSYTAREYTEPVHAVKNGKWVDIDKTLVKRADGSVVPKATTVGLAFSDGAAGKPFVTMTRNTHEMALTWPYGKLPAPVLDGDTATYPDALPGVDLKVRAEANGFGHLLVVKTPQAAADPRLTRLDLGLRTKGLTYKKDANGAVTAEDSTVGGTVFQSGAPSMWDSAASQEAAARTKGPKAVAKSLSAARADAPTGESAAAALAPALEGPGGGGKATALGIEVSKDKLTLVPDQNLLRDGATVFPVVIDPIQKTTDRSGWTAVMSGKPTVGEWQYSGSAGVGKCPTDYSAASCAGVGTRRVLFQIPLSFYGGKQILGATFSARVQHVYWADARAEPIQLQRVGGSTAHINSASNWNNTQGATLTTLETLDQKIQPTSCTSQANMHFKSGATGGLTNSVRTAANERWPSMLFNLKAQDESTFGGWKRVCGNAYLSISYNTLPGLINTSALSSNPGGACVTGTGRPYSDVPPTLRAIANDADAGEQVKVRFKLEWKDAAGAAKSYEEDTLYKAPTSSTPFEHTARSTIPENTAISWSVAAHDGDGWGPWSGKCEFMYDKSFPGKPNVFSAQYPATNVYHDGVGAPGTFTFSPNPNDTVPDTDVVKYRYTFAGETAKEVANTAAGGPASVTWTPTRSGPHWVDVVAVDRAGHPSALARHSFYVAAGVAAAAQWNLADEAGGNAADEEQGKYPAGFGPGVTFGVPGPGGTIDRAARFDGTADSWVDAGSTVLDTLKGFSVSAWVRPGDLSRDMTVVSQDGTGEPGFVLGYDATAKTWKFSIPTGDVDTLGEWKALSTGVTPVKDQWVLLTGIYDGAAGKIQLYVDKDLKGETVRRSTWKSYGALQIGRHIDKAGYEDAFVGDLAEVRVFSRPLLPAQITDIKTVRPERKGYWKLNTAQSGASPETGGGQALTMAGNAAIYIPNPDPLADPPPVDAMVGTGHLVLDGNGDYASTAAAPVTGATSFTLSARVQIASQDATASQTVFSLPGTNANRVQVRYQGATKRWELAVATTDTAGATVKAFSETQVLPETNPVGQHLAVVYDAFAGQIRLYVNGQLAAAQGVDNTTWAATGGLQVGRSLRGNAEYFAGAIDEIRAYNGALDPISVVQLAGTVELTES
ncbi:LamG domain-containing protein [Streptomyces yangpuensis]|uniref:LamG domain-containing protein n=1 Tax=Streptomyces yangpuensis TaxID=1648182 RepID=A0ABY5PWK9_9ACTN|nr:LamG domain-containing protein [Streptomyces yangpuensis]UUY47825.1 LamG domain-containing protein [Streptomyces yangpuensis]